MEKQKTVPEVRIIEGLPALPVLSAAVVSEVEEDIFDLCDGKERQ